MAITIRTVRLSEIQMVVDLIDEFDRVRSPQPSSEKMKEIFRQIEAAGGFC